MLKRESIYSGERIDWHRADIIAALRKNGTTLAALARESGYASSTLQNALDRKWPKGERIIASALGIDPSVIWPTRYENTLSPREVA